MDTWKRVLVGTTTLFEGPYLMKAEGLNPLLSPCIQHDTVPCIAPPQSTQVLVGPI